MANLHRKTPPATSFSFRRRLPNAIRELDQATMDVLEGSWDRSGMDRVTEIAEALSGACRLEGLREAGLMARSIASLMKVSREQIVPIESAFREKIDELMRILRDTATELLTGTG